MKAREYYESVRVDRESWRQEMPCRCMVCDKSGIRLWPPLQVHEIRRRSAAPRSWGHRCNYLLTCHRCHESILASMPFSQQLWIKKEKDPKHYDLGAWMLIYDQTGRSKAVSDCDVAEACQSVELVRSKLGRDTRP